MQHVLVVDDERDSAESMAMLVSDAGFTVSTARTLVDARRQIAMHKPDLVFLDLMLPDGSGMTLFEEHALPDDTEVVLVTGHGDVESSVRALRLGAADYLLKPVSVQQLNELLARVGKSASRSAVAPADAPRRNRLLGRSPAMRRVVEQIDRVAPTSVTVPRSEAR